MLRVVLMFVMLSGPAHALSCMRPDAVWLYETARDAEEVYSIAVGRLDGDVARPGIGNNPQDTVSRVRFVGRALDTDGFDVRFDEMIEVLVTCAGPWCGGGSVEEVIVALLHTEDGLRLEADPCAARQVPVTATGIERLLACHRSGICLPAR